MTTDSAGLSRLRAICLALPEAVEKLTWGAPTFRVRDRIFAMATAAEGGPSVWCKAPPGAQAILLAAASDRFFRPPYVGSKGWIGIWLEPAPNGQPTNRQRTDWQEPDWEELAELVGRSYRMTAPKRLLSNPAGTPAAPSRQRSPRARPPKPRTPAASTR